MKRVILICGLCVAATSAWADAEDNWIADAKTGCKVWNPFPEVDGLITWSGECKDNKADGKGVLRFSKNGNEIIIEGVMEDGRCCKDCSMTETGCFKYTGEFKDNLPYGKVTAINEHGAFYIGEAEKCIWNGQGELTLDDGQKYIGTFKNGKFDGNGTMLYKSGDKYSGAWSEGKQHGKGTYTFKDGTSYEGLWEHGERIKIF